VADRFHIVKNLTEATQLLLARCQTEIVAASTLEKRQQSEQEKRVISVEAPDAFELSLDNDFWQSTLQPQIQKRCPALAHVPIAQVWSGLYEMTPDEHPILGKTEVEGFLCASGFSGHGFMHAPMAAKLMTELIVDDTSITYPIEPFALERFRSGRLLETTRLL